ncbi:MAG: hypothetical protein JNM78_00455 [Cyclobacteriaceae bacterium]|nr:hypothetical protein [Cyclobacteriaceae bacterium]
MKFLITLCLILIFLAGCNNQKRIELAIEKEIQKQLDKCVHAVNTKNIDSYMDLLPIDFVIYDQNGEIISREQQRVYTLRDWAIIDVTLNNMYKVDSIQVFGDSVIAYTSQRWERLMFQRDGITKDTVLTTQRHFETWKKTTFGWLNYGVKELGGEIFINGELYAE